MPRGWRNQTPSLEQQAGPVQPPSTAIVNELRPSEYELTAPVNRSMEPVHPVRGRSHASPHRCTPVQSSASARRVLFVEHIPARTPPCAGSIDQEPKSPSHVAQGSIPPRSSERMDRSTERSRNPLEASFLSPSPLQKKHLNSSSEINNTAT
jgi:hypothetical protein